MTMKARTVLEAGFGMRERWECQTPGCGFAAYDVAAASDHSTGCGVNPDKPVVVPGLDDMLREFRKTVELETLETLVDNLNAIAEREGDPGMSVQYSNSAYLLEKYGKGWLE